MRSADDPGALDARLEDWIEIHRWTSCVSVMQRERPEELSKSPAKHAGELKIGRTVQMHQ
jgi:hypothetical protein